MASYTLTGSAYPTGTGVKTLTSTTADTITISPVDRLGWAVEVHNVGTADIDFRADGTAAAEGAPGTIRLKAGERMRFRAAFVPGGTISIVGNGNTYAVNMLPGDGS